MIQQYLDRIIRTNHVKTKLYALSILFCYILYIPLRSTWKTHTTEELNLVAAKSTVQFECEIAAWNWREKKKAKENFDCTIIYRGEIRERRWTEQTVYQLWPSTCWDQKQPWLVGLRLQQSLRLKCSKNSTRPANITLWVHSRPPTWHNFISNK